MTNKDEQKNIFHVEIMQGIYLISSLNTGPTEDGRSLAPGNPTSNSYLIIGKKRAILFDLAVNEKGLKEYAQKLAGKSIQLVLSHGHIDHTYHLNEFSDVWMHLDDEELIRNGMLGQPPITPCPNIHSLKNGDIIDLGNRLLEVFNVPGHTPGSILLLDRKSKVLLSGDTCSRRLLYGMKDFIPTDVFCGYLNELRKQDFDIIYSAHDRCALPKAYIEHMIKLIANELPNTKQTCILPGLDKMARLTYDDVYSIRYFDMVVPVKHMNSLTSDKNKT